MSLQVLGISHKTAPIDVREKLAIDPERLPQALRGLTESPEVSEALILSTCNRTELYCDLSDPTSRQPFNWLVRYHGLDSDLVAAHSYVYSDQSAVRHALMVACGLDSMVLGEPQILGQLKQAYRLATGQGTAGKHLHRLFQFSFSVAKQIRNETAIGENPVSVAYAAAKLAQQIHGDLSSKTALLIGAGETITLVANHLRSLHINNMLITNRTQTRAEELAARVGGHAIPYDELVQNLPRADIVVSSTASRQTIIGASVVEGARRARAGDPIFIVDLAVPRDVDPDAGELDDVYLYSVDDLNHVISENARAREEAAAQAETMIDSHTVNYLEWLQSGDSTQAIVEIRDAAADIKADVVQKARRRLAAGDDPNDVIEMLANNLTSKLLHRPIRSVRDAAMDGDEDVVRIARRLLGSDKLP